MNAFINSLGVLTAYGYMPENGTDTPVPVAEGFNLQPGAWQWSGGAWVAYTPPATWAGYQQQAQAALDRTDTTMHRITEAISLGLNTPTSADVVAFVDYRRSLRAIVSTSSGTPGTLPARPAYPAGT